MFGQVVTIDEGESLAREYKMSFFETSAFNDINVDEAFMRISKDVQQRLESAPVSTGPGATKATTSGPKSLSSADFAADAGKKKAGGSWCSLI